MALFTFTRKILAGEPIDVFNNGHHARDFTYIDDVVEGVLRTADKIRHAEPELERRNARSRNLDRALAYTSAITLRWR